MIRFKYRILCQITRRYSILTVVIFSMFATVSSAQLPLSLTTSFAGGAGGGGIYFNITAKDKPILITHFEVNFAINGMAEVYSKAGSHVGFEQTSSAWVLQGQVMMSESDGSPSMLDKQDVVVPANDTVGFYLFSFDNAGFVYSFGVAGG